MANTSKSGRSGNFFADISTQTWVAVVVVILAVWFVLANTKSVSVRFWIPTVEAPMWIILVGAVLVGAFAGWMLNDRRGRR